MSTEKQYLEITDDLVEQAKAYWRMLNATLNDGVTTNQKKAEIRRHVRTRIEAVIAIVNCYEDPMHIRRILEPRYVLELLDDPTYGPDFCVYFMS